MRSPSRLVIAGAAAGLLAVGLSAGPAAAAPATLIIGRTVIGHSVQGRAITAYHVGNPHSSIKAVLIGQMHGDEHAGVTVADALLRGRAVHGIDLWVIPTMNPDGDHAHTRQNHHGVDLNRNWPYSWVHLTGQYYSGSKALSEPETRAVYAFLRRIRPTYLVSIHQPLDGVDTTDGGARNHAFRDRLSRYLKLPEKPFRCWSTCHGNMTGWVTRYQKGAAITVEFPAHPTSYELTVRAPKAIVAAFRGSFTA